MDSNLVNSQIWTVFILMLLLCWILKLDLQLFLDYSHGKKMCFVAVLFWLKFTRECIFFTENKLEADWKQTGSGLEEDLTKVGPEADYRTDFVSIFLS